MSRRFIASVVVSLATVGLVVGTSSSSFSGTTSTVGNTASAATVSITDDDSGIALFNVTNAVPGVVTTKCITTEYTGSVPAEVALYARTSGDLAPFVNITVENGTTTTPTCAGFTPTTVQFTGTLDALGAKSTFATGLGASAWHPKAAATIPAVSNDVKRAWRITTVLADNNAAQGKSASFDLVWEARNL